MDNRLLSELQNGDDRQRRAASYRLGKSRDPDVVPYLIKAYNDPDPTVRRNVIDGLRQMATLGTYEASCFLDSDETDRQKIVRQVQQTGSVVLIEESVSHSPLPEPSPESIEHFERALEMWNEVPKSEWTDNLKLDIASELVT